MIMGQLSTKNTHHANNLTELKVLTWNVWFEQNQFERRMNHILDESLQLDPDVICYQEVLPEFVEIISSRKIITDNYHLSDYNPRGYGTITLTKVHYQAVFERIPFETRMSRDLLITKLNINGTIVAVGNVHLESLSSAPLREKQLKVCWKNLRSYNSAVLVGDFNFCSERNFHPTPGVPLENNVLSRALPGFIDVWYGILTTIFFLRFSPLTSVSL